MAALSRKRPAIEQLMYHRQEQARSVIVCRMWASLLARDAFISALHEICSTLISKSVLVQ